MAKLKPSGLINMTSGKVNGQVLSRYANGVIVKNIVQPSHIGNTGQRIKRFETNTISQLWRGLSPVEKSSYRYEAVNYYKLDKMGSLKPRTGYGLFLFLSQNLKLLNQTAPAIAPPFELVPDPQAYLTNKSATELSIKSDNTDHNYLYALFADANISAGSQPSIKNEKLCAMVDSHSLAMGLDVSDLIQQSFGFPVNLLRTGVRVSAIHQVTGNRGPGVDWLFELPKTIFVSGFSPIRPGQGHAFSQDGLNLNLKRGNQSASAYVLSDPWDVSVFSGPINVNAWASVSSNYVFSDDGLNVYVGVLTNGISKLLHYILDAPYNIISRQLMHEIVLPGSTYVQGIYISQDGSMLIASNYSGTWKYLLSSHYQLTSASLIQTNLLFRLNSSESYFFSTSGLTFFYKKGPSLLQIEITTPFDISQLNNPVLKTLNVLSIGNMPGSAFSSVYMPYSGTHFSIGVLQSSVGKNSIAVFKFASPFSL